MAGTSRVVRKNFTKFHQNLRMRVSTTFYNVFVVGIVFGVVIVYVVAAATAAAAVSVNKSEGHPCS